MYKYSTQVWERCRHTVHFFLYITLGFFVYFLYLYRPSKASTQHCSITGGNPPRGWQSSPWAGQGPYSILENCIAVRPPLLLRVPSPLNLHTFDERCENFWKKLELKGTLARDFWLLFFFSSKAPTWSPDSHPKFVSNINLNSLRYSNYSSLCVDWLNAELIFCFKLYENC
jgi:hypothetical protein